MKIVAVVLFIWLLQCSLGTCFKGCESPQYLQYRRLGEILCSFDANISAVFWYDSLDIIFNDPIVTLIDSVKGGRGYQSGEFGITLNGSLLIYEVNTNHGKNFSVATFISLDDEPSVYPVAVVIEGLHLDGCDSPQYLEYGGTGIIHCRFQKSFYGVFWYNSTETLFDQPILTYTQSVKGGRAYVSGEFDVFPNGSLIVREVRLVHEHNYTVAKFTSADKDPVFYAVTAIVIVKSPLEGPVIDKCESNDTICFTELNRSSAINCIVQGARPAVSLKWLTLTGSGHHYIPSNMSLISNNVTFTSRAVTSDAFAYTPVLSLLVCKAHFAPGVLQRDKSFVLVQNSQMNLSSIPPIMKYAPRGSTLELYCGDSVIPHLQVVWKRSLPFDSQYKNLMFGVFMKNHFETGYNDHFQFGESGSLILRQVDSQHNGFYGCIYSDGLTKYKVVTYVNPVPAYPVVEECNYKSHCVLDVNRKGKLTCSLTGIRPEVNLQWRESNETSSGKITFFDHTTRVTESGGTINISLTSSYNIISVAQVTVKCGVSGPRSDIFPSTFTTVSLRVVPAKEPDDSSVPTHNHGARIVMVLIGMVVGLLGGLLLFISVHRCRKRNTRKEASFENIPIVLSSKNCNDVITEGELCPEEYIRKFCSSPIVIRNTDTKFQHEFIEHVLKLASRHMISIPKVTLMDCFKGVNISETETRIDLRSDVRLPTSFTLKALDIHESGKILTVKEFEDIGGYIGLCPRLEKVTFSHCLLPWSLQSASLSVLETNRVRIIWYVNDEEYCMNLRSGLWELTGQDDNTCREMTDEEYQDLEQRFHLHHL